MTARTVSPPLLVNGRYRIVRPLGEGGMGNVFLASDLARQGRPVALKRIHPSILDAASVAGFKSEFELMSRLRHPNLVEVYDFEVDQATGDRFLTMEYVEGKDLAQHCGAGQPIPVTEAACLMAQICRGVEYIHRRGLIHNDLTAHNVRVTAGLPSICKVMDFGLASKVGPELRQIRGTLQYLAPEILKGEPSGRHSDIYSLGVLLYSMVTGRLPFDGDPAEIVRLATTTSPPAPGSLNPSVPPEIDSLALGMLSREPAGRPPTVDRVLAALSSAGASSLEIDTPATLASYVRGAALVGRGKEMERIVKALETAHGGAPGDGGQRPFLISGESGVGKSRLVEQTRYEAQLRGGTFAAGQCYEGSAAAYHPFVQILREAIPGAAADEALAPLMLPATEAPADASPSAIRADGEQEHRRVVDAAVQAIIAAAAMRPLTICLEDLQWADTASLDLLAHLARNAAGAPGLVLLATYRSEDAESPPLSAALPNLARAVEWDRIELSRLTREDVGSMLADMFGLETVPPAVVDLLMRETEGNPFFVQVAVESLLEDRGGIRAEAEWQAAVEGLGEIPFPASVADAIG
ncbi:MAG TPA: protein kinase, partial [Candidatus Polarisedimenticolia bacterium]|nr:protein kinase [Candidatus Polarisedimenticolia bacterium]